MGGEKIKFLKSNAVSTCEVGFRKDFNISEKIRLQIRIWVGFPIPTRFRLLNIFRTSFWVSIYPYFPNLSPHFSSL
jgi:hypothetical protein